MELSELILFVCKWSHTAVEDFGRGARRVAAEDLAFISNKITTELPNIDLPPAESSESPGPAADVPGDS